MEINYGDLKDNFSSNLKIIKALYKKSTDIPAYKNYHTEIDDISQQIYSALKIKYDSSDFVLPIVEKNNDNMKGLIRDLELSEHSINDKYDFLEFQDYIDNKDAYIDYRDKHGKDYYFKAKNKKLRINVNCSNIK
jgi:hypothetical protein